MSSIKVYGHPMSPPARRVLMCLEEKGIEYEYVHVELFRGAHKMEDFISINPFGQVPGFTDGDLKLYESRAITKYISEAYHDKGQPLISTDPKKNAIITVWLEVESQKFNTATEKLHFELVVKPKLMGMTADEAVVQQFLPKLASVLNVYEAQLTKFKYLAGDSFTLADLHHVPFMNNLMQTKVKSLFTERPHLSAWCDDVLARPSWKKVLSWADGA